MELALATQNERRKQVRLKLRADLQISEQRYEGKRSYVVKDPVSLRYYRFNEQEYFVVRLFDGQHTMQEIQKEFERTYRPHRLTYEDLEGFARQLLTAGLVQHESSRAAEELLESRRKQRRLQRIATWTNILYIKIPIFDPDRILTFLLRYLNWIFTRWFFALSVALMISAVILVATHYRTFYDKLPYYHEFFAFQTLLYMWLSLGVVKVIHEFGHGLSCKAFGGECHEMGLLLMCFSPALFCNVSDAWTMPSKWRRIIVSFAGIYVELIIAAIATWVWWYTPGRPFINNIALCLMVLCSISTFVFNANPLMKFDGYYMLADWLEIPNLRDRSNRYLSNLFRSQALGIEVPPEPYMALNRRILFVVYAVLAYLYRWFVTFSILYTLSTFLKPYKLGTLSKALTLFALGSVEGWPMYRMVKAYQQRGRLPDMKPRRVAVTVTIFTVIVLAFFLLPLPISRVQEKGLIELDPNHSQKVFVPVAKGATLQQVFVQEGDHVEKDQEIAQFYSDELEESRAKFVAERKKQRDLYDSALAAFTRARTTEERQQLRQLMEDARAKEEAAALAVLQRDRVIDSLKIRAPRPGVVMHLPRPEEIGKFWEDVQNRPVCTIGDVRRLRVVVPVAPYDYKLLEEDTEALARAGKDSHLEVSIRAPGTGLKTYRGKLRQLPAADAKTVPIQLTFKGGGSLATKPGSKDPANPEPQSQVYLVEIDIEDTDHRLTPGLLPHVKIHCRWRSAAWWVWRKIHISFDIGL
jgi:putative peptide zinc metalloprotease protein